MKPLSSTSCLPPTVAQRFSGLGLRNAEHHAVAILL